MKLLSVLMFKITKDMTADNIADELIAVCKDLMLHYRAGSIGIGVWGIIKYGKIYSGRGAAQE